MTPAVSFLGCGIACFALAVLGKEVNLWGFRLPETKERRGRLGIAGVGAVSLTFGLMFYFVSPASSQQVSPAGGTSTSSAISSGPVVSQTPTSAEASGASPKISSSLSTSPPPTSTKATGTGELSLAGHASMIVGSDRDDYQTTNSTVNGTLYKLTLQSNVYTLCAVPASITYELNGKYRHFSALVGLDHTTTSGTSVTFTVADDAGNSLGNPVTVQVDDAPRQISADVTNQVRIKLLAQNNNALCTATITPAWINPSVSP